MRVFRGWVAGLALLLAGALWAGEASGGVPRGRVMAAGVAQMVAAPEDGAAEARDWREELRSWLRQPDVDVALLLVGCMLIYVELNVPGVVLPGALGLLCVLLGVYGLWAFPLSGAAALFLLVGVMLFPLEAKLGGHGGLAALGTAMLVYGLAHLVIGSAATPRVHLGTAVAAGVSFGVITAALGWVAARARRGKRLMGDGSLVGMRAVARTVLDPAGQVEVRGELWQARMEGDVRVAEGAAVEIVRREDLLLVVGLATAARVAAGKAASRLEEV